MSEKCKTCDGIGEVETVGGSHHSWVECPDCKGKKEIQKANEKIESNIKADIESTASEIYASMSDESVENLVIQSEKYYRNIIKPFFENQKQIITEIHRRKGLGYKFQDKETGAVLKTVQEEYKSVSLFNLGIHRTRFDDEETRQSLSNKEAEESGFILKFGDRRKKK